MKSVSRPRTREASEPLFKEQSDAVKMSETPYPTNGSGKNLAKNTGVKYAFLITYAGFFASSDNLFFLLLPFQFCPPLKNDGRGEMRFINGIKWKVSQKGKNANRELSPLVGESGGEADGRGKREQIRKNGNKYE